MHFRRRLLAMTALVSATMAATAAFAQAEGGNVIEELVITAEKREQSLQDVPVAVTAFSDERREVLGVNSAQDDLDRLRLQRECGEDFVARRDDFARAFDRQCSRERHADAAAAAGHERRSALDLTHASSSIFEPMVRVSLTPQRAKSCALRATAPVT